MGDSTDKKKTKISEVYRKQSENRGVSPEDKDTEAVKRAVNQGAG